jgi:hypothetical protein
MARRVAAIMRALRHARARRLGSRSANAAHAGTHNRRLIVRTLKMRPMCRSPSKTSSHRPARDRRGGIWMHVSAGAWISLALIAAATKTPRGERLHTIGAHVAERHRGGVRRHKVSLPRSVSDRHDLVRRANGATVFLIMCCCTK